MPKQRGRGRRRKQPSRTDKQEPKTPSRSGALSELKALVNDLISFNGNLDKQKKFIESFLSKGKRSINTTYTGRDHFIQTSFKDITLLAYLVYRSTPLEVIAHIETQYEPSWHMQFSETTPSRKERKNSTLEFILGHYLNPHNDRTMKQGWKLLEIYLTQARDINAAVVTGIPIRHAPDFIYKPEGEYTLLHLLTELQLKKAEYIEKQCDIILECLTKGADANIPITTGGITPLGSSLHADNQRLIDTLVEHGNIDYSYEFDATLHVQSSKKITKKRCDVKTNYLEFALLLRNWETLALLNNLTIDGHKVFDLSAIRGPKIWQIGTWPFNSFAEHNSARMLKFLLDNGLRYDLLGPEYLKYLKGFLVSKQFAPLKTLFSRYYPALFPTQSFSPDHNFGLNVYTQPILDTEVIERALKEGIDTSYVFMSDGFKTSAVEQHFQSYGFRKIQNQYFRQFELLCQHAKNLDYKYTNGTLLEQAIRAKRHQHIEVLLRNHACPNVTSAKDGAPPVVQALRHNDIDCVFSLFHSGRLEENSITALFIELTDNISRREPDYFELFTLLYEGSFEYAYDAYLTEAFMRSLLLKALRLVSFTHMAAAKNKKDLYERLKADSTNNLKRALMLLDAFNKRGVTIDILKPIPKLTLDNKYTYLLEAATKTNNTEILYQTKKLHTGRFTPTHSLSSHLMQLTMEYKCFIAFRYLAKSFCQHFDWESHEGKKIKKELIEHNINYVPESSESSDSPPTERACKDGPDSAGFGKPKRDTLTPHTFFGADMLKQLKEQWAEAKEKQKSNDEGTSLTPTSWLSGLITTNHPAIKPLRSRSGCNHYMILDTDTITKQHSDIMKTYLNVPARLTKKGNGIRPLKNEGGPFYVNVSINGVTSRQELRYELKKANSPMRIFGFVLHSDEGSTPLIYFCKVGKALHSDAAEKSLRERTHTIEITLAEPASVDLDISESLKKMG